MLIIIYGINQQVHLFPCKDDRELPVAFHFGNLFGIPHIAQGIFKEKADRRRKAYYKKTISTIFTLEMVFTIDNA